MRSDLCVLEPSPLCVVSQIHPLSVHTTGQPSAGAWVSRGQWHWGLELCSRTSSVCSEPCSPAPCWGHGHRQTAPGEAGLLLRAALRLLGNPTARFIPLHMGPSLALSSLQTLGVVVLSTVAHVTVRDQQAWVLNCSRAASLPLVVRPGTPHPSPWLPPDEDS